MFYGITSRGKFQTSDELSVFVTGASLATRGQLQIDEFQWLQDRVNIGQTGPDGHLYIKYFPGNVLASALVYKLTARADDDAYVWSNVGVVPSVTGARWCTRINALWGALGMTALLLLLRRYFDWRTAIATVVLVGACSDWWYQSRGFFSEVGSGAFLMAGLCFAAYEKPSGSALGLALSMLFRPTNLLALPIWASTVWRKGIRTLLSGLIIIAAIGGLALYNWLRFRSPLNFGYGGEGFSASLLNGLYGVLLSPGRSIFVYSPVLLLAVPGAILFFRKEKTLTTLCLITVITFSVAIGHWHAWAGGLSWGSRLMTAIVPVLGVLIAPTLQRAWKNKWIALAAVLLAVAGFSVQVISLLRDPTRVIIEQVTNGNVKWEETLYSVKDSWLALQVRSLSNWQSCDLDSYTLRRWLTNCPE
ncbi:MAG: hypothetical protein ABI925_04120 [Verrucomicrobiota bacterium]